MNCGKIGVKGNKNRKKRDDQKKNKESKKQSGYNMQNFNIHIQKNYKIYRL